MKKMLILLLLLIAQTLIAATFNVSTTPELRTALENAATNGEDDTIILADGTYKTTDDGEGTFTYLSNENNNLILKGTSSSNVILSGDHIEQIFKHTSTSNAPLKLEKLTFMDGNNTLGEGGGVYSNSNIEIINCNFNNNIASGAGGGFYTTVNSSDSKIIIKDSSFTYNSSGTGAGFCSISSASSHSIVRVENSLFRENNTTGYGGAFYLNVYISSTVTVLKSIFLNNQSVKGAGFYSVAPYSPLLVKDSIFKHNIATSEGGGFYYDAQGDYADIVNSIFTNNSALNGVAIFYDSPTRYPSSLKVLNSLFSDNNLTSSSSSIYIISGTKNLIYNSIFYNNTSDINGSDGTIIEHLDNNYIDTSKLTVSNFPSNNIFTGVNLGFVDATNGDYNLTASSDLIDAGTTTIAGVTLPTTDLNGNARVSGATIDIGPYEFSSTKPTLSNFTYSGTAKELNELTFSVAYTLDGSRTLDNIVYDYNNDGSWTSVDTHAFDTAGTYTVKVKVTDSEGEFSITSLTLTIAPLAFADMTDEQKFIKAIDPAYYDSIMAIISAKEDVARASGVTIGENNVILNPATYNLVTQTAMNTALANATIKQTITVKDGWKMVGVLSDIDDFSVFRGTCIDIIWQYKDGLWKAYSTDSKIQQTIASRGYSGLTSIKKSEAFWIHGTSSCQVKVFTDNKPTAKITGANTLYYTSETLTLNGSDSNDDGSIVSYSWKLDGAEVATGATYSTSGLSVGTHTITLDVVDDIGQTGSSSVSIKVINSFTNLLPMQDAGGVKSISSFTNNGTTIITLASGSSSYFKITNNTKRTFTINKFEIKTTYNGSSIIRVASSNIAGVLGNNKLLAGKSVSLGHTLTSSETANYWTGIYYLTDDATGITFTNSVTWNGTTFY